MKKSMVKRAQADEAALELGKVLGQSLAFGIVAGRCSAAQAAALRQVRGEKIYKRFRLRWREFCPRHLKMSGTQADEIVRLLDEFGPEYFEHTESVRISGDTYRLVAPFIQEKALRVEGEVLELNSANVQEVARRVRESRRALPAPAQPAPAPAPALPAAPPNFQPPGRAVPARQGNGRRVPRDGHGQPEDRVPNHLPVHVRRHAGRIAPGFAAGFERERDGVRGKHNERTDERG